MAQAFTVAQALTVANVHAVLMGGRSMTADLSEHANTSSVRSATRGTGCVPPVPFARNVRGEPAVSIATTLLTRIATF